MKEETITLGEVMELFGTPSLKFKQMKAGGSYFVIFKDDKGGDVKIFGTKNIGKDFTIDSEICEIDGMYFIGCSAPLDTHTVSLEPVAKMVVPARTAGKRLA